ncbi:hypothetical protein [Lewinella sp. IMCC34183]|uniref:hypothetical protein n=1 Tax=Lewinella sp. IMCC34183 TaxID=2248762 RepID=UPI0018E59037|nr:hypothetical protein [Lewinella sp. IMCC34183]
MLSHLQRLMVSMCAPTLRERFDENNVWRNPATERYMAEIRELFTAEDTGGATEQ